MPRQVEAYCERFPGESKRLAPLLRALARGDDVHSRRTSNGHLSASAIVLRSERLLAVHHPYLQRWMQPGGHLDDGESPQLAALRETLEETGTCTRLHPWHDTHPCPVDIDIHSIPANPSRQEGAHLHFDFRYVMVCESESSERAELPTRWAVPDELEHAGLGRLILRLRTLGLLGAG